MSSFNDPNGQYRRPRLHFSDEKQAPSPALDRRSLLTGSAMLLGLALILCLALLPLHTAEPDAAQTSRDAAQTLTADCTVLQQMTYAPCGHRMTRRIPLPQELTGKTLSDLTAAYDGDYFETGRLLALTVTEPSGSIRHTLAFQGLLWDQVTVERQVPEVGTCDLAAWLILAEVDATFDSGHTLKVVLEP